MTKIKFYILSFAILGIVAGSTISCKKAIELEQVGAAPVDSVIRNESDLFGLINGGYVALAGDAYYGGDYQTYNELLGDHIAGTTLDGDYLGAYNRNVTIFNAGVSAMYAQISAGIYSSNIVLDRLDLASTANKNAIEGQAKFIRGLCFFDLVRIYAQPYSAATAATDPGIPLRLNSDRQKVSRKTVAEVYAQILSDLKSADTLLATTNGVYATKWSAKAIIAKVYFQMNDFTNAYLYANEVITNSGLVFNTTHGPRYSAAGSSETAFGLVYELTNITGRFQKLRNNYNTLASSLPTLRLTNTFYTKATANATDVRKSWYKVKTGFYLLGKFDSPTVKLPVIHLTELKLIRAEAAAESNTNLSVAVGDMNDIINRAYGPASPLVLAINASPALIRDAARRERELELVGEGNWVQDLKRRGAKGETITIRGAAWNCPGEIFPFPTNEVNYSSPGFIQNPSGGCN